MPPTDARTAPMQLTSSVTGFTTLPFELRRQIIEEYAADLMNYEQHLRDYEQLYDSQAVMDNLIRGFSVLEEVGSWDIINHLLHALKQQRKHKGADLARCKALDDELETAFEQKNLMSCGCVIHGLYKPATVNDLRYCCSCGVSCFDDYRLFEQYFDSSLVEFCEDHGSHWHFAASSPRNVCDAVNDVYSVASFVIEVRRLRAMTVTDILGKHIDTFVWLVHPEHMTPELIRPGQSARDVWRAKQDMNSWINSVAQQYRKIRYCCSECLEKQDPQPLYIDTVSQLHNASCCTNKPDLGASSRKEDETI